MSLNFTEAHDAILAHLRDSDIPNVFDTTVPAGFELPRQNNTYLPYVLVSFSGKAQTTTTTAGITGSRDNLKNTLVAVECVGASPGDARRVADVARDKLDGYIVDESWSELSESLAGGDYKVTASESDLWPVRFATGMVFTALTNAVT